MQGTNFCSTVITKQSKDFSTGSILVWTGEDLGSCANMHFEMDDSIITFKMKTLTDNEYKPVSLHLWMTDGYEYFLNTDMWDFGGYSINQNEMVHTATKISGKY